MTVYATPPTVSLRVNRPFGMSSARVPRIDSTARLARLAATARRELLRVTSVLRTSMPRPAVAITANTVMATRVSAMVNPASPVRGRRIVWRGASHRIMALLGWCTSPPPDRSGPSSGSP